MKKAAKLQGGRRFLVPPEFWLVSCLIFVVLAPAPGAAAQIERLHQWSVQLHSKALELSNLMQSAPEHTLPATVSTRALEIRDLARRIKQEAQEGER